MKLYFQDKSTRAIVRFYISGTIQQTFTTAPFSQKNNRICWPVHDDEVAYRTPNTYSVDMPIIRYWSIAFAILRCTPLCGRSLPVIGWFRTDSEGLIGELGAQYTDRAVPYAAFAPFAANLKAKTNALSITTVHLRSHDETGCVLRYSNNRASRLETIKRLWRIGHVCT